MNGEKSPHACAEGAALPPEGAAPSLGAARREGEPRRNAYPMFNLKQANVPDDLCPVGTTLNPMLPGDWRSMRPVVDRDKCVKCAVCWLYCPVQCVEEKAAWFDFNMKTCKGCGICARECPQRAISMVEEAQ